MPAKIGRYLIQRRIGAGGMAVVYAALQESPRRVVALKVMRPGIAASSTARRFKREMEILARLRHPNIAQIHDAGMWDDGGGGMPYFVMEYIPEASPIDERCDAKSLDLRGRLKLFVKVCAGVQHGHAQGIVHRDLKPGNILVDAQGEPKIIDYGVARAAEADFGGATQQTEAGKLVGTVAFMSPEQVEARGGEIDPRTDVYALGVILYRLLTDRSPYPLSGMALHEAIRVIREDQPIKPSVIRPELKGDLETILLTALQKDRTRRYADAGAMGRDVLRFLAHKPIKARPAGPLYRLTLFVRRNRSAVIATTAIAAALLLVAAGGLWIWRSAVDLSSERERLRQVDAERQRSDREARAGAAATLAPPTTPARERVVLAEHAAPVRALAGDGAGRSLASLDDAGTLLVWDLAARRVGQRTSGLDGLSGPMAMMPAGDRVLLGRIDGLVEAMRVVDGEFEETPLQHTGTVSAIAASPDGRFVASAATDLVVQLWPTSERAARPLRAIDGAVASLAFGPAGRPLAAGMASGDVATLFDLRASAEGEPEVGVQRVRIGRAAVASVALDRNGSLLAAGSTEGVLRVAPPDDTTRGPTTLAHDHELAAMALHPSGRTLASADFHGHVRLWSVPTAADSAGGLVHTREFLHVARAADGRESPVAVRVLLYTGDGAWLAVGGADGRIVLMPVNERGVIEGE
jgi:hypothetical protein